MFKELIARQDGVLTRQQAYACGLTKGQVEARLRAARWQRLAPRVFATFTGLPPRRAILWSAVLSAGRGACLSHDTAAELQGLAESSSVIHVTVPALRRVTAAPGMVVHLSARVAQARHPTRLPPQTRIEETIVDLTQRAVDLGHAVQWLARACGSRLTTADRISAAMARRAKLCWRPELQAALTDVADGCHSPLELRYLRDVERAHGLPTGERQAMRMRPGGRTYDDVQYRRYGARVELDGKAAHPWEGRWRDARRDNEAVVDGYVALRYGWADVNEQPCATAMQVATVLRRNGWRGALRRCGPHCLITKELASPSEQNSS